MGRHTKLLFEDHDAAVRPAEEPAETDAEEGRRRWFLALPLLPVVALVIAIAVIAYAMSTSQISLNFAGGAPREEQAQAKDNSVTGGQTPATAPRRSLQASGAVIAFRAVQRLPEGFRGTATITNRGDKVINGWVLGFRIPNAQILSATNSRVVKTGRVAWVQNTVQAPAIRPGQSVRITFVARGAASRPSACKFNKVNCTLA